MFSQLMCPLVSSKRAIFFFFLALLFLRDEETDTDCAVGGVDQAGLSLFCTSKFFLAPIFVYSNLPPPPPRPPTPKIYLYKTITVSLTVILLGDVTVQTRGRPSFHAVHMHVSLCGSVGLQSVEMSTYQTWGWTVIFTGYTQVVNPTPTPTPLHCV